MCTTDKVTVKICSVYLSGHSYTTLVCEQGVPDDAQCNSVCPFILGENPASSLFNFGITVVSLPESVSQVRGDLDETWILVGIEILQKIF